MVLGAAIAAPGGVSELARAATLTETDILSIDTTTAPGAPSSESLSFAQFNTSLGTLTSVSIELTGSADSVLSFINNSPSSIAFTNGTSSTALQLSGSGFATQSSPTLVSSAASGTMNGSATSPAFAYTYFAGTGSAVDLTGVISGSGLAAYEGAGLESLTAAFGTSTSSASFSQPGGSLFAGVGGGGQAAGEIIVTYNYTPVPVPAALPLLLSGIAGLGVMARRRRLSVA